MFGLIFLLMFFLLYICDVDGDPDFCGAIQTVDGAPGRNNWMDLIYKF